MVDGRADGWHRLEAVRTNGESSVDAIVTDMTDAEAQWAAAQANLTHGLPLKPREVRVVFRAYVRSKQHRKGKSYKTYREISGELSHRAGHTTIRNWMKADFPKVYRAMGDRDPRADSSDKNRDVPHITPLARAMNSLDQAAAEAPALSPEDRQALLDHLREIAKRIEAGKAWESEPENTDF